MRNLTFAGLMLFCGLNGQAQPSTEKQEQACIDTVAAAPVAECKPENSLNGVASFYHNKFVGRKTATGAVFSNKKYTAASNKFELGTYVKVVNTCNNKCVYVLINDRMAASNRRLIDLTHLAASDLGFVAKGTEKVTVSAVGENEGQEAIRTQADPSVEIVKE